MVGITLDFIYFTKLGGNLLGSRSIISCRLENNNA